MADLLSQIQQKAKQVGTMMGQSTGVLQRDAVPVRRQRRRWESGGFFVSFLLSHHLKVVLL